MDGMSRIIIRTGAGLLTLCAVMASLLIIPARGAESDSELSLPVESTIITDVTFTSKGRSDIVTVLVDHPFIYSYYRLTNPLRAVVDLALTDPGSHTEPLTYQGGALQQIRFSRLEQATGMLTHMECFMADGADFSVKMSQRESRKLILTFTPGPSRPHFSQNSSSVSGVKQPTLKPAVTPHSTVATAASSKSPTTVLLKKSPAAKPKQESAAPPPVAATSPDAVTARKLLKIIVTADGIDLITDGPVKSYTVFPMKNPNRLVVDLPGVRVMNMNPQRVGAFGIARARFGGHEGKSRIVFDGATAAVLRSRVIKTETGLRLLSAGPDNSTQ